MTHNLFKKKPLKDVFDFYNGKAIKPGGIGKYPVYGSNGLIGGSDKHRYENGVIIGRVGAYCGSIEYCKKRFWASDNTIVVQPKNDEQDILFLYYLLVNAQLNRYAGGVAQPLLTQIVLKQVELEFPPLCTQQKIAFVLSAYDDLIENNTRRIQILEEMAQAIYRQWFVEFEYPGHESVPLVDSGTALGAVPEGWKVKTLKDFGEVVTGKTPSKKKDEYWNSRGVPFIRTPDMHNQFYCIQTTDYLSKSGADSQSNKYLPPNSLCVSCIGTVGIVTITAVRAQTNQQINSIVLSSQADLEFLYFALLSLKNTIQSYGSTGATMANLSKGKFMALQVVTPPKKLRVEYHEMASPMFEQIKHLQQKNTNLRATRDLLLPRLVSGEVGVEGVVVS